MSTVFKPSSRNSCSLFYQESVRCENSGNSSVDSKVKKVANPFIIDLGLGIIRSRVLKVIFSAVVLGISTWFLIANPHGLMMSLLVKSIIIGLVGLSSLSLLGSLFYKNGLGIISFELGTLKRKLNDQNFGEINLKSIRFNKDGKNFDVNMHNNILLGSIPQKNILSAGGEIDPLRKKGVKNAFGVVQKWEREALGLSVPYTSGEWESVGIHYTLYDCADHGSLNPNQLLKGANQLSNSLSVAPAFVHCKAGQSRSAILVAAAIYLAMLEKLQQENIEIKNADRDLFFNTAVRVIKKGRPESHIDRKKKFLDPFFDLMLKG